VLQLAATPMLQLHAKRLVLQLAATPMLQLHATGLNVKILPELTHIWNRRSHLKSALVNFESTLLAC
jgi:hypothetical protein